MSDFIVSARKYRPSTFDTVVGQMSITTTLKNSIKNNHLAQAYLFCGSRGVGKTTCARIYAKTINCLNITDDIEACNECESCKGFNASSSYNIHELDAASNNSVEDIRNLIDQVRIPPQLGKYSIYIIDEVHMLSNAAFNAFLKTLEEPPKHAIFILATTEKHKILPTILSRCQIFDFNRIKVEDAAAHLASVAAKENISVEPEALNVIALKADGAMRDALSIFDQVVSFCGNTVTYKGTIENLNVLDYDYFFKLVDYFLACDYKSSLLLFDQVLDNGFDGHNFINGLATHFRDLLVSKDTETLSLLEVGAAIRDQYKIQAEKCSADFLLKLLDLSNRFDLNYKASKNKRLHVELALLQYCNVLKKKDEVESQVTAPQKSAHAPAETKQPQSSSTAHRPIPVAPSFKDMMAGNVSPPVATSGGLQANVSAQDQSRQSEVQTQSSGNLANVDVVSIWKEYVNTLRNSHPRIFGLLLAEEPYVENKSVVYRLLSKDQLASVEGIAESASAFFSRKAGCDVSVQFSVSSSVNKPTLASDKYAYLKGKNPNLDMLKDKFDLDI